MLNFINGLQVSIKTEEEIKNEMLSNGQEWDTKNM